MPGRVQQGVDVAQDQRVGVQEGDPAVGRQLPDPQLVEDPFQPGAQRGGAVHGRPGHRGNGDDPAARVLQQVPRLLAVRPIQQDDEVTLAPHVEQREPQRQDAAEVTGVFPGAQRGIGFARPLPDHVTSCPR